MKKHIYAIILLILMAVFSCSFVCFAGQSRVYINDSGIAFQDEEEEPDEEEEEDEEGEEGESEESGEEVGPGIGPSVDEDEEEGGVSTSPLFENIGSNKYWVGWRKHHYGYSPEPTTYKSQEVTFKYRVIRNGVRSYETSTAVANGYGIYNMDYSKHMIGFLNYAKSSFPEDFTSTFVDKTDLVYTGEGEPTADPISIKVACQKVMNKIIATWYSKDYEESTSYEDALKADGFRKFWTENFSDAHKDSLRKAENEFFRNVYSSEAESKLNGFINKFKDAYKPAIKGVIFSIMESRYRNKNLQGKANLKVRVSEKELWPFYVYCEKDASGHVIWPKDDGDYYGIDKVIDGAYQYMYYYDSEFQSTSHSTLTSFMLANETDEEPAESDWEAEYEELTGKEFPYLYGNDLQAFYDRITRTRTMFTESADNAEGIFGAEEQYTNTSDFSFSKAMSKMQDAMLDFCTDENGNIDEIWSGLTSYNAPRSYLMAKNIVENERLTSEYAYYDIGTNILTYSAGRKDSTILLKDLQRVCLKQSINDPGDADTDEDGINDKNELITSAHPVNITKFVEKMVMSELYGKNQEGVTEAEKTATMTAFKNNVRSRTETKRDDNSAECSFTVNASGNLMVELYDYTSNPVIKDTDFDGLTDKEEGNMYGAHSEELLNNKIAYAMNTKYGYVNNAETHMDYRYFFMNNKNYYDELSTMSLMLCNELENNQEKLREILTRIGMLKSSSFEIKEVYDASDIKVNYISYINEVEYTHNADETPIKKKVKLIVVKSIDTTNANLKNIENIGENTDGDYYSNNHEVFDKLAKKIYEKEYNGEHTYWITGYNTGGAVANILSARIIDIISTKKVTSESVYCYTFGSPYTEYNNGDCKDGIINTIESKYCSIYNVINNEDIYAFVPTRTTGWTRYGVTAIKSGRQAMNVLGRSDTGVFNFNGYTYKGNEGLVSQIEDSIDEVFSGYEDLTRSAYYKSIDNKSLNDVFDEILDEYRRTGIIVIVKNKLYGQKYFSNNYELRVRLINLIDRLNEYTYEVNTTNDIISYYALSKCIVPNDLTFIVQKEKRVEEYDDSKEIRFKEILQEEFNFNKGNDDKNYNNSETIELINKLYKGILHNKKNMYDSNAEFHRLLGNTTYFEENQVIELINNFTQLGYNIYDNYSSGASAIGPDPLLQGGYLAYVILLNVWDSFNDLANAISGQIESMRLSDVANYYDNYGTLKSEIGKYSDGILFNDKDVQNVCDSIRNQHLDRDNNLYNDFANLCLTLSVEMNDKNSKNNAQSDAARYNGINDIDAQYGFIRDICGVFGSAPALTNRKYMADLDAVNLYHRYINNKNKEIYDIFTEYYDGIQDDSVNRAEEFLTQYDSDTLNRYKNTYKKHMTQYRIYYNNEDFNNRLLYFDNFIKNLEDGKQVFEKIIDYNEYYQDTKKMAKE